MSSSCCNHTCTTVHGGNKILDGALEDVLPSTVPVVFAAEGCCDKLSDPFDWQAHAVCGLVLSC